MSKPMLVIEGQEYVFGQEYLFSDLDKNWIKAILKGYKKDENYCLITSISNYKYIKPLPTELDILKEELTQLIKGTDQAENFKKKVRHLVNKQSCVIPHSSITGVYKNDKQTLIRSTDNKLNLPEGK